MSELAPKRRRLFSLGNRVKVCGLTSEAGQKINGLSGTVIAKDSSGRLKIELSDGIQKALKPENLVAACLPRPGQYVEVHSLKSETAKAMNGKRGVVRQKRDPITLRYQVEVEYGGGVRAAQFKAENLTVLDEPVWGLYLAADAKSLQGKRPSQEDRHVQVLDLRKVGAALRHSVEHLPRPCALFAVFDGHMGSSCSDYAAKNIHMKILPRLATAEAELPPDGIKSLLQDALRELDEEFIEQHQCPDGSTATVALLLGCDLYVTNLGDSCGMLCDTKGLAVRFDFPEQKPGSETERQRIAKAGGDVVQLGGVWRVAHSDFEQKTQEYVEQEKENPGGPMKMPVALAVSRSLGDRGFKFGPDGTERIDLVCCLPEVEHVVLKPGQHRALVLMSDGVTDVMTLDEVGKKVIALDGQPKAASVALCQESLKRQSQDNVSAVTVFFKWPGVSKA